MRRALVGLVLVAGCAPDSESWFGEVGEQAFRDHGVSMFELPALAEGLEVESDEPDVIRLVTPEELGDDELPPSQAWFVTGEPGFALVTLVDPSTGEELDAIEVEVVTPSRTALVPAGPWKRADGVEPRILAGVDYHFRPVSLDAHGSPLVGFDPEEGWVEVPASPPGEGEFHGVTVAFVNPADVVSIDLVPATADGIEALVAVGRDRDGREVLGLPAAWTAVDAPGDRGDVFAYLPSPGASPVEVTASWGDLAVTTSVETDAPGSVGHSDRALGCSSTGTTGWTSGVLALVGLLGHRRRSRAAPTGTTTLLPH